MCGGGGGVAVRRIGGGCYILVGGRGCVAGDWEAGGNQVMVRYQVSLLRCLLYW